MKQARQDRPEGSREGGEKPRTWSATRGWIPGEVAGRSMALNGNENPGEAPPSEGRGQAARDKTLKSAQPQERIARPIARSLGPGARGKDRGAQTGMARRAQAGAANQ